MKRILKIFAVTAILLFTSFTVIYFKFPGTIIGASIKMARMAADVSASSIIVGDHTWPYLDGGEGEAIIFLHGFGMHKDLMVPVARGFSKRFRVIIPDLPAFGKNKEVPGKDYSVKSQSQRLHRFISTLKLKKFHLVGLSMGGGIASFYTTEHPDMVKSLTIIGALGTNPGNNSAAFEDYRKDNSKTLCIKSLEDMDRVFKLAYKYPPEMPEHFKEYLIPVFSRYHQSHTRILKKLIKDDLSIMEPRLRMIKAPTLLIWGKEDRIVPVECAEIFRRGIKNSRLVILDDCGHVTFVDKPEKTISAIDKFLIQL